MAEYIEREAALQIIDYAKQLTIEQIVRESGEYELLSDTGKACYDGMITALVMCKRLINEAVIAADVQPIVYAHKTINVGRRSYCSNCGKLAIMEDFCSKCGAKVKDGEQSD